MIQQFWGRIKKQIILRTAFRLILIYIVFVSLVTGISLVVRGVTETMLTPLVIIGILVGWGLARENLSAWWEFLGGGTIGFLIVVGRVGKLAKPLGQVLREEGYTLWGWLS